MSVVPGEIAGIGPTTLKLRVATGFDPMKAGIGPEEYFVLSRIDGTQTLREILLATGLPLDRAIAVITKLRSVGALLLPNETAPPAAAKPAAQPAQPAQRTSAPPASSTQPIRPSIPRTLTPMQRSASGTGAVPASPADDADLRVLDLSLPDITAAEKAVLAEAGSVLDDTERRKILAIARHVRAGDPWALLGVPAGADKKLLKKAYFKLSKDFHPDRYYGRSLGTFGPRLEMVFEAISRAYAQLTDGNPRSSQQFKAVATPKQNQPQSPQEYAAELFDRACQLEVNGDALEAMKLFSACVRVNPQTRYLRRAATCALAARQPKTALEYAKKAQAQAPDDPSNARLLATAFRAAGKLADAEEVLVMAMALKSENDVLGNELRNDLAEVRRLLAQG